MMPAKNNISRELGLLKLIKFMLKYIEKHCNIAIIILLKYAKYNDEEMTNFNVTHFDYYIELLYDAIQYNNVIAIKHLLLLPKTIHLLKTERLPIGGTIVHNCFAGFKLLLNLIEKFGMDSENKFDMFYTGISRVKSFKLLFSSKKGYYPNHEKYVFGHEKVIASLPYNLNIVQLFLNDRRVEFQDKLFNKNDYYI